MNNLIYNDQLPQYMVGLTRLKQSTNQQFSWLQTHGCKAHRHRYNTHFSCFLKEYGIEEKIGYIDTEFYVGRNRWGRLAGDWGFILCYVLGDGKGNYASDCIKPDEIFTTQDKRIVESCITEIKKYDRLIHHFGDGCDIPLLRTRALIHGLDFPGHGEIYSTDLYKIAKNKLTLSSNSQRVISKVFTGKTEKTEVEGELWLAASRGDKEALDKILLHCQADVRDLERNARKLLPFIALTKRSI